MDVSTQTHLKTLRDLLLYRLAELAAAPATVLGGGLSGRDAEELRLVEAALRRLDAASYGDCAECGEPIPLSRLLAQPAAECCAACQRERVRALESAPRS